MNFAGNPLFRELDRFNKEADDIYHDIAFKAGISNSAFMVLYYLWELGDGCSQKDICDRCFLSKQTTHSAVRKLEQEGLLQFCAGKGRDLHLVLTEQGNTFIQEKILPVAEAEQKAFSALTTEEQAELVRLNQKYLNQLRIHTRHLT